MNTPPKKWKQPWWMFFVYAFGAMIVLAGAGIGGFLWWLHANKQRLVDEHGAAVAEGTAFAAGVDQDECVREAPSRSAACDGLRCEARTQAFLETCVKSAEVTPGLCDPIPPESELLKHAAWRLDQCAKHGQPQNQRCSRVLQAVSRGCRSR
jgi:hypothetical protein